MVPTSTPKIVTVADRTARLALDDVGYGQYPRAVNIGDFVQEIGKQQVYEVTAVADVAASLHNTSFVVDGVTVGYNVTGEATPTTFTVTVTIASGATAVAVTAATITAINAYNDMRKALGEMAITAAAGSTTSKLLITSPTYGVAASITNGSPATGFTFVNSVAGVNRGGLYQLLGSPASKGFNWSQVQYPTVVAPVVGTTPTSQLVDTTVSLLTAVTTAINTLRDALGVAVIAMPSGKNIIRIAGIGDVTPTTKPIIGVWGCNDVGSNAGELLTSTTLTTWSTLGTGVLVSSSGDIDTKGYPYVVVRVDTAAATGMTAGTIWYKTL